MQDYERSLTNLARNRLSHGINREQGWYYRTVPEAPLVTLGVVLAISIGLAMMMKDFSSGSISR